MTFAMDGVLERTAPTPDAAHRAGGSVASYVAEVVERGPVLVLLRGARLCGAGDPAPHAFAVVQGRVALHAPLASGTTLVGLAEAGETVSALEVLVGRSHAHHVFVHSETAAVVRLPRDGLRQVISRGDVDSAVADLGWPAFKMAYDKIDVLSAGGVKARIAALLLLLAQRGELRPDGRTEIRMTLSRRDLASFVCTTPETAIRIMTQWQRDGVVTTTANGFVLSGLTELREVAGLTVHPVKTPSAPAPESKPRLHLRVVPGSVERTHGHRLRLTTDSSRVYFDSVGRLHRAWLGGAVYELTFTGRVRRSVISRDRGKRKRSVQLLDRAAADSILERCHDEARRFLSALPDTTPEPIARHVRHACGWTRAKYADQAVALAQVYRPVPVLPPELSGALVLQPSEGCAWNRCSFCNFYSAEAFRVKSPETFREHVRDVVRLVGPRRDTRQRVFLGQASILHGKPEHLESVLRIAREELGRSRGWRFGGFANPAGATAYKDLSRLRQAGLESLTLGLESGEAETFRRLNKPTGIDDYVAFARKAGEAGIRRGVVLLVGAGGTRQSRRHVEASARAAKRMHLDAADRVYLSPLSLAPETAFAQDLAELGVPTQHDLSSEEQAMRVALALAGVQAKVARYNIDRGAA